MSKFKKYLKENYIIPKLVIVVPLFVLYIVNDIPFYSLAFLILGINFFFQILQKID